MNRLLGKKPKKEEAADASESAAAAPATAVAYMRVLKDYSLLMEYKRLKQQAPTGIYVLPAADSLRRWYGVIFVRKGHYRGAIFKFCLMIPLSYPDEGPKVHFLSEVFHPLIHPDTGLLDLSLQFSSWSSNQHYIVLLLCYIKKIFYKTDMWEMQAQTQGKTGGATTVKEAMNPKAQNLWMKNRDEYLKLCERNALKSQTAEKLYGVSDDVKQSIVFSKPRPAHEEIARRITRGEGGATAGTGATSYLEWFAEGVHKIDGQQMAAAGSMPSVLPPPPTIHTTGASSAASGPANLLGAMSPISPVLRAAAADAASGGDSDADDPPAVTLDQLAK